MNIVVPIKLVPDLVEELKIDDHGLNLDPDWLRLKLNELDDHALEQALLLKERGLADVTVIAPPGESCDEILFNAAARGANRLLKLSGDLDSGLNNHALARLLFPIIQELQPDLVLTGVQAHNDLDGSLGPLLAGYLDLPYLGYISGIQVNDHQAVVRKEFPGGLITELVVDLPAVFGIQAAEHPPRYIAISRIRQAMKTARIEEIPCPPPDWDGGPLIGRLYLPEKGHLAEMITGDPQQVAAQFVHLLSGLGVL